ncbi:polymer-forming cytoskeletal protein [Telluria mixta]|uniref:Polymer-forming cytoskeletal protein n=1 Tax=Telluria mixta TaxID=34071 RepID=A0ABT2C7H8_9BURK|nr:polymer-forming cytoskeletal protein [Telluria mixta]MCS0633300.1 polymer-forming cytoskeletal protein [Telluria mixta]WEM94780.1 polymer-forming cytoskeletal protein [Telluria mixta]
MFLRRFHLFVLALMLSAAGGPASAGAVYTFGGIATVGNCTLSGAVYTCPSLPLTGWDDSMVIASGYTVNVTSDVSFGYNHSLTMSGSAVLSSTGNLDIGGIKGDNLNVDGGTFVAANTFRIGSQVQTVRANIKAADADLGTGSGLTINGSVTATGSVDIATHAVINGNVTGATITARPGSEIYGNIVAKTSFELGSQGTVKGDITAPVVNLLPAQSNVTGKITAKTSLEIGSQVNVYGDVVTGTLTMNPAKAIIDGNATVDSAVLGSQDRVTQVIYCTGGTRSGQCDCVTNNSGYEVNTEEGPHCQGNVVPLDHFLIAYDPAGSVCAPSTVTITACANQACTATYGGGGTVTLAPTGQSVPIPTSGIAQATVAWTQPGTFTLGASGATTANATTCIRNGDTGPGADCKVAVASSAYTMTLPGQAFYAEAPTAPQLTIAAVRFDAKSNSCVPLFNNVERNINFTCAYGNPTSGTLPVRLNGTPLNGGQNAAAACDSTGTTLKLTFNADGKVAVPLQYADAGAVTVKAADSGAGSPPSASVTTVFAPAKFAITLAGANAPYVAGKEFTATVTALNGASTPAATPNFGRESVSESAKLAPVACQPINNNGLLAQTTASTVAGVQTLKARWSETGRIDLLASLTNSNGYLGTNLQPATATTNIATTGCTGAAGTFSPAYFTFDTDTGWKRTSSAFGGALPQYYSGEPAIKLTVTARNLQNGITQNYAGTDARDVLFTALNPDGTALAIGAFSRSATYPATDLTGKAQLRGTDFTAGIATWTGSHTFTTSPTGQTRLRVRATEDLPAAQSPASSSAIPSGVTTGTEPTLLIRSGRIRMPSRFGPAGATLKIPVSIEYYTGQTWILNNEDSTTALPAGIVSTGAVSGYTIAPTLSPAFTNGKAELTLTPSVAAHVSAPFAINLGTTTANTSCYAGRGVKMTTSTGANLAFLRSVDASCTAAGAVDPSALATFGVYAPETKRIIHTREVFR